MFEGLRNEITRAVSTSVTSALRDTPPTNANVDVNALVDTRVTAALDSINQRLTALSSQRAESPVPTVRLESVVPQQCLSPSNFCPPSVIPRQLSASAEQARATLMNSEARMKAATYAKEMRWANTTQESVQIFQQPVQVASLPNGYNWPYNNTQTLMSRLIEKTALRYQAYNFNPPKMEEDRRVIRESLPPSRSLHALVLNSVASMDLQTIAEWYAAFTIYEDQPAKPTAQQQFKNIEKNIRLLHRARQISGVLKWTEFELEANQGQCEDMFGERVVFPVMALNL